ncbi:nucleotide pyrophosphohydrolase [Peribacillus castrilensis]|nr:MULTISPECIES: nucleotide pyrophosphohydrolase [Bacillaceae]MCF7623281.1 nucleotide pyrophosphohydrolase [Peribacillus frigoritolerans]MCP1094483.1 nucleotide pyrophosphohydrolase [Bacillaceae bacterium OS4b]MCT1387072.1 nucleotide pyrophosphohydrolase [Peribacillus frigoritolerans]MEA3573132.1 nucleotide pyrophosphohydrolase [Peribacillus frigoritolerans]
MFENENQEWVTHMEKQKTIQQMQAEVDQYIGQFKEGYFSPLAMLARMSEELGELAREVNHYHGEKPKKATEEENTIEAELGDMLFVLICFANSLGIDLQNSHDLVMEKFTTRDKDRWTRKEEEMKEEGKDE